MKEQLQSDTRFVTPQSKNVNATALGEELRKNIEGEVRFDDGSRALYATDSSNYRQIPIGVVIPKSESDIIATVAICRKYRAPLLSRGCGTSLAGQCCNVAVIMDMSKYYNRVLTVDVERKLAMVQTGIVLDAFRRPLEKQYGLTFGPDPATHDHCTIGGMLGNNSCGVHSVMAELEGYGARTSDNVERLTILTYEGLKLDVGPTSEEELENIIAAGGRRGEIYRQLKQLSIRYATLIRSKYPDIPRLVSGYNLAALLPENGFNVAQALVGSEGTCVTILDATLRLLHNPKERVLLVLGFEDVYAAGAHIPLIMKHKPIGVEGIDEELPKYMKKANVHVDNLPLLPAGKGWLLVEFGADTKEEATARAVELAKELEKKHITTSSQLYEDAQHQQMLWDIREAGLGATVFDFNDNYTWPGWEDAAVSPAKVGDYLRDFRELLNRYGYEASLYGHFGQGCIHCSINFDLQTHKGIQQYKQFTEEAAHLVVSYGGSLSGEHGDGQARGDLLEIMYGKELVHAFREFKSIWDPEGRMNPGKIVETYGQLSNLKLGEDYEPAQLTTHFSFADDKGSFSRAINRCFGVGKCRQTETGTMCPSYMATTEEMHTTRGRSRMLFEMLQGTVITDGWKSKAVKQSLDLCLSCKGCKGDCPVHVDMATYKSEFLSHYYEGKIRPRTAYAFGWIYWWARAASVFPRVANFFTQTPPFTSLSKAIAGVAPQRTIPTFATQTFRTWFKKNIEPDHHKPRVILWADTFNNFFLPDTLKAGVDVLQAAGYDVMVPKQMLCCGRPLYDFGMLKTAKKLLLQVLDTLRSEIRQGVPVVGLEPSCVAVFRDELCNLLPNDEDAKRLKLQTFTLAEFLEQNAAHFKPPQINRKMIIHGHCHQKAIMKMTAEQSLLKKMNGDFNILNSGCCGMAGYFGYERGSHYDVSVKVGERALLPAVRDAERDTLIVADGFSCREQIKQQTNVDALHLAEVIQLALKQVNDQ